MTLMLSRRHLLAGAAGATAPLGLGHRAVLSQTVQPIRLTAERRTLDVNLWGVIHGCRAFGRQMVDRGTGGHIVNVSSAAAFLASKDFPVYGTSKAAVLALSESLRSDFAGSGIGVTAVCPGPIRSGFQEASQPLFADRLPQFVWREPDRVARLFLLASPAASSADQIGWCAPQLAAIRADPAVTDAYLGTAA